MFIKAREMSSRGLARLAVGVLVAGSFLAVPSALAQRYDDPNWHGPRGYDDAYHENGNANPAARQGYSAGFSQGESDARAHHSFRPTHVDTYKNVPDSPGGVNRDEFKRVYREAFEKGYAKGYGR